MGAQSRFERFLVALRSGDIPAAISAAIAYNRACRASGEAARDLPDPAAPSGTAGPLVTHLDAECRRYRVKVAGGRMFWRPVTPT